MFGSAPQFLCMPKRGSVASAYMFVLALERLSAYGICKIPVLPVIRITEGVLVVLHGSRSLAEYLECSFMDSHGLWFSAFA